MKNSHGKALLMLSSLVILSACSPVITEQAAGITVHTKVNKLLDGCKKLGPLEIRYESKTGLNREENETQSRYDLKQQAYDRYQADNIVIIRSQYIEGGYRQPDMFILRGIAYRCH
ncbi:MAG: hypothetical protein IMF14_09465 [Proteobacteria bacterium]|nr:hypothetical protein [Pseudomonadota bacterium]